MNKKRFVTIVSLAALTTIATLGLSRALAGAMSGHDHHGKMGEMDMKKGHKTDALSLEKIHTRNLPMVSKSIEAAIRAVESGDKETALAKLHKAQKMLAAINAGIAKHIKPKFDNVRCPIMDLSIDPDKVTKDLIRDYKGQRIAFCCETCFPKWDKLTDAEKNAKLTKAKPTQTKEHSAHKH